MIKNSFDSIVFYFISTPIINEQNSFSKMLVVLVSFNFVLDKESYHEH